MTPGVPESLTRSGRANGKARRKTGAAAVSGIEAGADRGGVEAD
jgi:hypothetical protein